MGARIEIRAIDEDVRRYLESRIDSESKLLRHVETDPDMRQLIVDTVVGKAKGMFLLAQLHMDSLATKNNRRHVQRALEDLPKSLDSTYDNAMKRISSQNESDSKLAEQVLSWISYAFRPLTVKEVQEALAVEPGDTSLNEEGLPYEDSLVPVCAGLVTIDKESNIIRLVHYTAQEYFQRIRSECFPDAQQNITLTCLTYLSFDTFAEGYCPTNETFKARLRQNHLLDYAGRNWGNHARGGAEQAVEDLALKFLKDDTKVSGSGQVLLYSTYQSVPQQLSGLHLLAYFGLKDLTAKLLLEEGVQPESKDGSGRTPLSWAAREGHEAVVRLLLGADGVDPDSKDRSSRTPLSLAAGNGHEAAVRLLLTADGVDPESKDDDGWTPLSLAAGSGHEAVAKLILPPVGSQ